MRFIHKYSYACANYLMKQMNENHEKRRVYYFGFQIMLGSIVKGILLLLITLILGTVLPTLTTVIVFAALRTAAGGYHMNTYGKCIAVSLVLFILSGLIAKHTYIYWEDFYVLVFTILTFISGIIVSIKWAPKDTPNKPITEPDEIRKFKKQTYIYVIIWFVINSLLIKFDLNMYAIATCFGILLELFSVTPIGYSFFDSLSGKVDKLKEK